MKAFQTKAELIEGYAEMLNVRDGVVMEIGRMIARDKTTYAPHINNLGWFIRGFGFSVDRKPVNRIFRLEAMA